MQYQALPENHLYLLRKPDISSHPAVFQRRFRELLPVPDRPQLVHKYNHRARKHNFAQFIPPFSSTGVSPVMLLFFSVN
jgi:hypothetical protein